MLVIGIDPGTAISGYGLVREDEDNNVKVVDYGVIRTSSSLPLEKRLLELHKNLRQLLLLHHPKSAAVEKLFFQRNVRTAMSVGQARGVVLLALTQENINITEYSPREIKQAVSGYGGAEKIQVQHMVRALLGLNEIPQPDDAADALAVAICHLHSMKMNEITREQG